MVARWSVVVRGSAKDVAVWWSRVENGKDLVADAYEKATGSKLKVDKVFWSGYWFSVDVSSESAIDTAAVDAAVKKVAVI